MDTINKTVKGYEVPFDKPLPHDDPSKYVAFDFDDDDIQAAVDEIAPKCDEYRLQKFEWFFDTGELVAKHYSANVQEIQSQYGKRFYNRLAQDLNNPDITECVLRNCHNIYSNFDRDEYMALRHQPEISFTHVLMVCGLLPEERDEFIQRVITEKLTTRELDLAILEKFGRKREKGAGRPPKISKNVRAAVVHIEAQAKKYLNLHRKSWFCEQFDLGNKIKEVPLDKTMDGVRELVEAAARQCRELAQTAADEASVLEEAAVDLERREAEQAKKMAEYEANEREEAELDALDRAQRAASRSRSFRRRGQNIGRAMHA